VRAGPVENGKRVSHADPEDEQDGKRAKSGITEEALTLMTETSAQLSKGRKKRAIPEGTATGEDIASMALSSSHPLHQINKVTPSPPRCFSLLMPSYLVTARSDRLPLLSFHSPSALDISL